MVYRYLDRQMDFAYQLAIFFGPVSTALLRTQSSSIRRANYPITLYGFFIIFFFFY